MEGKGILQRGRCQAGWAAASERRREAKEGERRREEAHGDAGKSNLHSLSLQSHSSDAASCQEAEVRRVPSRYVTRLPGSLHKVQDGTRGLSQSLQPPQNEATRKKERRGCDVGKAIVLWEGLELNSLSEFSSSHN